MSRRWTFAVATLVSTQLANANPYHDAHAEMATALRAHLDLRPAPAVLPVAPPMTTHTASTPASSHGPPPWAHAADQAGQGQGQGQGQATAAAHRAQAAADAAAGQVQGKAAEERASHPHPH